MATIEAEPIDGGRSRIEETLRTIADNREMLSVVGHFAVVLITSALLAPMLGIAWQKGGLGYLFVTIPVALGLVGLASLSVLLLGIWLGLLVLWLVFDVKKRVQGTFLLAGTLVTILGLCSFGLVCGNLNLASNLEWLVGGLFVGTLLGGIRNLSSVIDNRHVEFRDAAKWVFYLGSLLVVVGFLEAHFQYPLDVSGAQATIGGRFGLASPPGRNVVLDAALTGTFVYTLGRFIRYDAETDLFVLGPTQSGKSLLLLGSYYEASESGTKGAEPQPNTDLYQLLGEVDSELWKMVRSQEIYWPISGTQTDEALNLGFEYVYGAAFPKNITVETVDYAGEWLELVPDIVTMDWPHLVEYAKNQGYSPAVMADIKRGITAADVLVFIIDVEKHVAGESLDIDTYHEILEKSRGKTVLLVATKCDLLSDHFERETGLDALSEFEDFRAYVTRTLSHREQVRSLVARAAGSTIHPVWYQTRQARGDADTVHRVPSLTEDGQMVPVGFEQLLDHFGRGR